MRCALLIIQNNGNLGDRRCAVLWEIPDNSLSVLLARPTRLKGETRAGHLGRFEAAKKNGGGAGF